MHKIKVTIDGLSYALITDQSEADIVAAADHLNMLLHELKKTNALIDRQQQMIIVALQLASELLQSENKLMLFNSVCKSIEAEIDQELAR
jgi:cell division protein ZapA (FtsZ GTPase activity inhibitor)